MKWIRLFPALLFSSWITIDAALPQIDSMQILEDLKILSSDEMEGRKVGTPGSAKARDYIIRRFRESGIKQFKDSYVQPFVFTYKTDERQLKQSGVNVIGLVEGIDSEMTIVVTAHYDHLGIEKEQVYNGADDNASGVAALFAIGSYFSKHPPQHTFIIAALDAEEKAGAGGMKLVAELERRTTGMNVNLDMLGRDKNGILYAAGTHHYPFLKSIVENIAAKSPVELRMGHDRPNLKDVEDWTKESDHYAFHLRGIPFIYFGVEDYEHHHKPTDDFENITHDFYLKAVQTVLIALREFDKNLNHIQSATIERKLS